MKAGLKVMLILTAVAALPLGEVALMYWIGGRDVRKFCEEIKPGTPIEQVVDLANRHDVRFSLPGVREDSGTYKAFFNTPRSFGRHVCRVRHDNTVLIESKYEAGD